MFNRNPNGRCEDHRKPQFKCAWKHNRNTVCKYYGASGAKYDGDDSCTCQFSYGTRTVNSYADADADGTSTMNAKANLNATATAMFTETLSAQLTAGSHTRCD